MFRRITVSCLASVLLASCSTIVTAKRPNVMIIFADDVGTGDVPGYWNDAGLVPMPNLENLLKKGTTFTDAHSTPLCAPSRYVLLSGNYQHRGAKFGGSWTVNYEGNQFRTGQKSIAQLLGENGYITSMVGKWHLGGKIPLQDGVTVKATDSANKETMLSNPIHDWDKPMEQGPWDIGFDNSYITMAGIQNPPYVFLRDNMLDMNLMNITYWDVGNYSMPRGLSKVDKEGEGAPDWDSTEYNMILVEETENFLDDYVSSNSSSPFFSYVALGSVHIPHSPPDKYLDGTSIAGVHETPHMDNLAELDLIVGSLTTTLEQKGLLNDTIVIFASDNGGLGLATGSDSARNGHYSSGPLRSEKASIYEGGHRIPMTIMWENGRVPKGEKRSHYVSLSDLYATICELVGVQVPPTQAVDSVSFAKYLKNEDNSLRLRKSLGAWSFMKFKNRFLLGQESIRKGSLKLIHHYQNDTFELYDLANDISEKNDLIDITDPKIVQDMYAELKDIGPCHDRAGLFYVRKQKRKRACAWFRRKHTFKRCAKFPEGYIHCGLSCALRSSQQCKKISELLNK